jgi:hypothetical protein
MARVYTRDKKKAGGGKPPAEMPKPSETDREEVWFRDDRRSEQGTERA